MSDIKIQMFPALAGDSFIVTTNGKHKTNILIDCGYGETYDDYLKDEFMKMVEEGSTIDLMVITHIDADHISGAIKFLEMNNSLIGKENFIKIDEIWHNSLRHIYLEERYKDTIEKHDEEILKAIKMKGMPIPSDSKERRNKKISAIQGSVLGGLIKKGNYNWNTKSMGKAISIENISEPVSVNEIKLVLLSPNNERLNNLKSEWQNKLIKSKKFKGKITDDEIFDDVFEILLGETFDKKLREKHKLISGKNELSSYCSEEEQIDNTPINCSSISFILEFNDKKVLFLGDSNPDDIYNRIKSIYKWDEKNRIFFNAIKISHHGSKGNTSKKLLQMIDSDKFIISTNGNSKYNHPDIETIAKIVCRESEYTRELIFNYKNIANKFNNEKWMKEYKYSIRTVDYEKVQEIFI